MKKTSLFAFVVAATAATIACSQTPAAPVSPSGTDPISAEAGPNGETLKVSAPTLVSPVGGVEITDRSPDLVINNAAPRFSPSLPLSYVFEVRDEENRVVYTSPPVAAGADGRTQHEVNLNLDLNEGHTWRAWAVYQNARGPLATPGTFRTFNRFGVSCTGSELDIVACRKAQYGHIEHDELPEFLEKVAYDLNHGGHEHAPYGRLVKNEGNNCHGYSCDIICSNANGSHRQWDILLDEDAAQVPAWNRVGEATVRPCEAVVLDKR